MAVTFSDFLRLHADFVAPRRRANASAFLHRVEFVVVSAASAVIERQTLTEGLVEAVSQLPVAAAAGQRRLRADVLRLDVVARALAFFHRLEAVGVAAAAGVRERLAFSLDPVKVETRKGGGALSFGHTQTANVLDVDFHAAAGLFAFVAREKLVGVALTTAVVERAAGGSDDVVVKHGDVVIARTANFGQRANFHAVGDDASTHAFSLGREPVGVAFAAAELEAAAFAGSLIKVPLLELSVAGTPRLGQRANLLQLRFDARFATSVETVEVVAIAQAAAVGKGAAFPAGGVVGVPRHGGVAGARDQRQEADGQSFRRHASLLAIVFGNEPVVVAAAAAEPKAVTTAVDVIKVPVNRKLDSRSRVFGQLAKLGIGTEQRFRTTLSVRTQRQSDAVVATAVGGSAAELGRSVGAAFEPLAARRLHAVATTAETGEDAARQIDGGNAVVVLLMVVVVVVVIFGFSVLMGMRLIVMVVRFHLRRYFYLSLCRRRRGLNLSEDLTVFVVYENLVEVAIDHVDSGHGGHRIDRSPDRIDLPVSLLLDDFSTFAALPRAALVIRPLSRGLLIGATAENGLETSRKFSIFFIAGSSVGLFLNDLVF